MLPHIPPPVIRISVPPPEPPRPRQRRPHPPAVVAAARGLVEGSALPLKAIAARLSVDSGTLTRWAQKHGWTRPPGAPALKSPRPAREAPAPSGRALATRLRVQAERLVQEVERAPAVDVATLAEALKLLAQARAEQHARSGKKRPPEPPPSTKPAAQEAERRRAKRAAAAQKRWRGRYSKRNRHHAWMLEPIDP